MENPKRKEISPPDDRRISTTEELSTGRRAAEDLKAMIGDATKLDSAAKELVEKVINSFSNAIYDLGTAGEALELKQDSLVTVAGSLGGSVDHGSEYSAMKKRKISPVAKDRRGGCRRRSIGSDCRSVSAKTLEDGFTWRKYGQKEIFNSQFPRSYFRCTHKYDKRCQATRQVQKSEVDSNMYVITYIGEHMCKDQAELAPFNASSNSRGSCVISFGSSSVNDSEAEGPFFCPPSYPAAAVAKQETDEDVVSSQSTPMCSRSSAQFFMSPVIDEFAGFPDPDGGDVSSLPTTFMEDLDIYLDWDEMM